MAKKVLSIGDVLNKHVENKSLTHDKKGVAYMKHNIRLDNYNTPEEMEYTVTLNTEKEKTKFIKRTESIIRSSLEYRDYIAFLKDYVDMNHCAFFSRVENSQGNRVRIEIHHEPLTLFDIVQTVLNKHLDEGIPINDLFIADEVLDLHYKNQVGLIPLSKSIHQIVHNSNELTIPLNLVYGNYKQFVEDYNDYLDDAVVEKLQRKIDEAKAIKLEKIEKVLTPTYVYVNVDGYELPKKMEVHGEQIA